MNHLLSEAVHPSPACHENRTILQQADRIWIPRPVEPQNAVHRARHLKSSWIFRWCPHYPHYHITSIIPPFCRPGHKQKIPKSPDFRILLWFSLSGGGSWGSRTPDPLLVRQTLWTNWAKLPFFRFFLSITASGGESSVGHYQKVTPSRLSCLPCSGAKINFKIQLFVHYCVRRRIVGRSLPKGNSLASLLPSLFWSKNFF